MKHAALLRCTVDARHTAQDDALWLLARRIEAVDAVVDYLEEKVRQVYRTHHM